MGAAKEYKAQMDARSTYEAHTKPGNEYEEQTQRDIDSPPPPPYSSTTGSQSLDVNYRHWTSDIAVTDSAGQTLFISQTGGCSSTHLDVFDRNSHLIGHSKSSNWTSKISFQMGDPMNPGPGFEIHNTAGFLGGSPKWTSPAFDMNEMVWKNKAMSKKIKYELFDNRGTSLARFESNPKTRIGKLEIGEITGEERINEVAITLLTLLHRKLRNIEIATVVAVTS